MTNLSKGIKDLVHGIIPVDVALLSIIDTPIFQRLGRVKQLTSAEYVFPGARHTRKEHCMGAMFLASKYAQIIGLNEYDKKVIEIAALLHDIGHGPYSHSWDAVVYVLLYPDVHKGHDIHRHSILYNVLNDTVSKIVNIDDVAKVWNNNNMVLSSILQGPLGVDRMDFVKRDTLYTDTTHFGYIETARIINSTSIYTKPDGKQVLCYQEKVIPDAIQGLTSRLYMYNKVYLHKTVIAASILFEAAIQFAIEHLDLIEKTRDLHKFVYLTDSILDTILSSNDPRLEHSQYYIRRLYNRELPKLLSEDIIYLSPEIKTKHLPGINIDMINNKITWVGRLLSNDFAAEFDKYDIHVMTKEGVIPFREYWRKCYSHYQIETYYIKRVYSL